MTYTPGYNQSNNVGGIGPYSYRYRGFGPGACCPDPAPCCDSTFELDYGTKQFITVDWSNKLASSGECKVLTSTWHLVDTASEPLSFGEQKLESGTTTKIMVGGGIFGGEYKIVNTITTEEGTSHKCVICVTVVGCLTGGTVLIGDACSSKGVGCNIYPLVPTQDNTIPCETPAPEDKCVLETGIYTGDELLNKVACSCITEMTFVLIEGSATYIDGTGSWPIEECGTIIENGGACINNFVLKVNANSSVFFTKKGS